MPAWPLPWFSVSRRTRRLTPVASCNESVLPKDCVAEEIKLMGKSGHPRGSKPWVLSSAAEASRGNVEKLPRDNHQGSERNAFHHEAGYMTSDLLSHQKDLLLAKRGESIYDEGDTVGFARMVHGP